jgi:FemAB-related protein (PEP-CTERM system-associated)
MRVALLTDQHKPRWDEFVLAHPECSLYHHWGWKEVVERSYGHTCFYLLAEEGDRLLGILPLVKVKSMLFGSSLTSLPYLDSAGVVVADDHARQSLLDEAIRLTRENNLHHLELRQTKALENGWPTLTHKVCLTLSLQPDLELLWKSLPPERRNRIRKAEKNDLSVEFGGEQLLPVFYDIWTENMRDLGSPPHSFHFFDNILKCFPSCSRIVLVKHKAVPVGGAVCLFYKKRFHVPWVSSLREYFDLYPNNLLYWEAMKHAASSGYEVFDFGRSSIGSGTYIFKLRWGAKEEPLFWQYKLSEGSNQKPPSRDDFKQNLAVKMWKRMPVGATRLIGPKIRKFITA